MNCILQAEDLTKIFNSEGKTKIAVDHLSFSIPEGASFGIVGESGCGKTTTVRMIAGLEKPTQGKILLKDDDGRYLDLSSIKSRRNHNGIQLMQMIFQNPQASFDPRRTLGFSISENLDRKDKKEYVEKLITACGMEPSCLSKYPHQISGGQCQRAAIVRAIASHPRLLLLDEPTSALDVTVQRQILDLLKKLRREYAMSFLFITHDLAVAQEMCDFIMVMKDGKKIEENTAGELISHPQNSYTKLLLESVLQIQE